MQRTAYLLLRLANRYLARSNASEASAARRKRRDERADVDASLLARHRANPTGGTIEGAASEVVEKAAYPASGSNELLRSIVDSTTDGLWSLDAQGRTTFVNPRMAQLLDRTPEEMSGFAVAQALDVDGRAQPFALLDGSGGAVNVLCSLLRADGTRFWTLLSRSPLRDGGGVVQGWLCRVTERPDRTLLRDQVTTGEQQLAEAQSIARLGSWEWDIPRDVVTWSDQLFRIYEFEPQEFEATYETFLGLLHAEDRPMVDKLVRDAFEGEDSYAFEARIVKSSGREGWIRGRGRVTRDQGGAAVRMSGTAQEITEAVQASQELAAARDQAVRASRLKSDFLATMSHEIRTPLNGVIGLTDLLRRTELDPSQQQLATGISQAGRTLLGLLNDILDLSKIEAGKLELEVVDFEVREVVDQVMALVSGAAHEKGVGLAVRYDADVPRLLRGDPVRFGQVITNLVSNAVKFTQDGHVAVRVGHQACGADGSTVRVEVADTGIGIPLAAQTTLFDAFTQAEASTSREYGGTGLGLNISRRLVQALSGDIGFTSDAGVGTTFWFTSVFEPPTNAPAPQMPLAAVSSVARSGVRGTVLVAEDNELNRLVAGGMLEELGYTAEFAHDGEQAVAQAGASPERFVAVLMDSQMPRLDGYAATRAIRRLEPPSTRIPVIAMTASVVLGEEARCLAAGMDDFMVKPVDLAKLGAVLDRWTTRQPTDVDWRSQTSAGELLDLDRIAMLETLRPGDHSMFAQFVESFTARAPHDVSIIHAALEATDASRLAKAAHRLRGCAENLGAVELGRLCADLEQSALDGDLDSARMARHRLDDVVTRTVRAVQERAAVSNDDGLSAPPSRSA